MPKLRQNYSISNCRMQIAIAIKIIEKLFNVPKSLLLSKTRKGEIIRYRAMIYHTIYNTNPDTSLEEIGFHMGGKDHATVLNGKRAHESFCVSEKSYVEKYELFSLAFNQKMEGENIGDDNVLEMIKKIERMEEDLMIIKGALIKTYSEQKLIDPETKKKIDSIPNINSDDERAILEADLAAGIQIPASEQQS